MNFSHSLYIELEMVSLGCWKVISWKWIRFNSEQNKLQKKIFKMMIFLHVACVSIVQFRTYTIFQVVHLLSMTAVPQQHLLRPCITFRYFPRYFGRMKSSSYFVIYYLMRKCIHKNITNSTNINLIDRTRDESLSNIHTILIVIWSENSVFSTRMRHIDNLTRPR